MKLDLTDTVEEEVATPARVRKSINVSHISIRQKWIVAPTGVTLGARFGIYDADDEFIRQSKEAVQAGLDDIPANIKATMNTLQQQIIEWQQAEGTKVMKAELGAGTVA